mgnify:CR=1 FL=1
MYFLAGVGRATLLDGERLVATANTLIDSSITIRISFEDIRAGLRNKLYGRYAHTSTFDLKLTDAMFSLEYLAMNTGSDVELGGDAMKDEKLTVSDGKVTLTYKAVPMVGNTNVYAYVKKSDTDEGYQRYAVTGTGVNEVELDTSLNNTEVCVRYMYHNDIASKITISANFIPKTLTCILEANLYNGGSCDVETSTLAGKVIIKVPRFMLNGSQELSMSASGVSNTSIEGSALASGCAGCDGDGVYAEIVQVLENKTAADMFASIVIEDKNQDAKEGDLIELNVYACPVDGAPIKLSADQYEVTVDSGASTYANGVITVKDTSKVTVKFTLNEKLTDTMTITVA